MWIEPENPGEFDNAIGGKVMDAKGGEVRVVDDDKKVGFLVHIHLLLRLSFYLLSDSISFRVL